MSISYVSEQTVAFAQEGIEEENEDKDIPTWKLQQSDGDEVESDAIKLQWTQLEENQRKQLRKLLLHHKELL